MTVGLYLILVTFLFFISLAGFSLAGDAASTLYERDVLKEPESDRQHALLGRCVEWTGRMASSGWMFLGLGHAVIYAWTLAAEPLREGWMGHALPWPLAAIGLIFSVITVGLSRLTLHRVRVVAGQYDEILVGREPDWADGELASQPRLTA